MPRKKSVKTEEKQEKAQVSLPSSETIKPAEQVSSGSSAKPKA